jgi:hypothetical protein
MWLGAALFSAVIALISGMVGLIYWMAFPQALAVYVLVGSGVFAIYVLVQLVHYSRGEASAQMETLDTKLHEDVGRPPSPLQGLSEGELELCADGVWGRVRRAGMRRLRTRRAANVFAREGLQRLTYAGPAVELPAELVGLRAGQGARSAHWLQVSHDPMSSFCGRSFVLADTADATSRGLTYDLSTIGFDADMCGDHDAVLGLLQSEGAENQAGGQKAGQVNCPWSVLLVDLDFLTQDLSLEEVVDDLLSLRQSMQALNIILLSDEVFGRSEADTTRLAIADVSLRTPASAERLREAVWDARCNNMIWQNRLQEDERLLERVGQRAEFQGKTELTRVHK